MVTAMKTPNLQTGEGKFSRSLYISHGYFLYQVFQDGKAHFKSFITFNPRDKSLTTSPYNIKTLLGKGFLRI